ncbi:hypothetical protein PORCRE_1680 [Porphyromonas crevioricanis JCM 15906]|uniref:Uncharacterized protein n=1 Tax=Porphyromonas crevioricanis JCM 15906 TaxID=1305617 RepID=T1CIK4_9PORP|nr:hypothetical protein PORCRE_1680 [Porphyromonas crevioricanis JCM 15906]
MKKILSNRQRDTERSIESLGAFHTLIRSFSEKMPSNPSKALLLSPKSFIAFFKKLYCFRTKALLLLTLSLGASRKEYRAIDKKIPRLTKNRSIPNSGETQQESNAPTVSPQSSRDRVWNKIQLSLSGKSQSSKTRQTLSF